MTSFIIPKGTIVLRAVEEWNTIGPDSIPQGATWKPIRTTHVVTYDLIEDLVGHDNTYYVFRLPPAAAPWTRLAVRKNKVVRHE